MNPPALSECVKCGLPKNRHYKVRLHRSDPDHKFVALGGSKPSPTSTTSGSAAPKKPIPSGGESDE